MSAEAVIQLGPYTPGRDPAADRGGVLGLYRLTIMAVALTPEEVKSP